MPTVYLKRDPDGSPNAEGPSVRLPDEPRYLHRQAAAWIARAMPDVDADGAGLLAYIEAVSPEINGGWGDLLGTFVEGRGDRAGILRRRLAWLQGLDVQAVDRIGMALVATLDAAYLTKEERGN